MGTERKAPFPSGRGLGWGQANLGIDWENRQRFEPPHPRLLFRRTGEGRLWERPLSRCGSSSERQRGTRFHSHIGESPLQFFVL